MQWCAMLIFQGCQIIQRPDFLGRPGPPFKLMACSLEDEYLQMKSSATADADYPRDEYPGADMVLPPKPSIVPTLSLGTEGASSTSFLPTAAAPTVVLPTRRLGPLSSRRECNSPSLRDGAISVADVRKPPRTHVHQKPPLAARVPSPRGVPAAVHTREPVAARMPSPRGGPATSQSHSADRLNAMRQRAMERAKMAVDQVVEAEAARLRQAVSSGACARGSTTASRSSTSARASLTSVRASIGGAPSPRGRPSSPRVSARGMGADPLLAHGYQTLSPIANGAFSQIVRAKHLSTSTQVAVKTFKRDKYLAAGNEHLATAMKNELEVLRQLQPIGHAHIANVLAVVEDATHIRAMLEYCGGGSLKRLLVKKSAGSNMSRSFGLEGGMCHTITQQLASALSCLHESGIAHRDIKPDNVLFVDDSHSVVKLCDFGFAVACGDKKVRTVCGTPQYMSPEIAGASLSRRDPYLGWACDMWAFAAVVFEMLEGKTAYRGSNMEQLNIRILRASHEAFTAATPPAARGLIKSCFELNPERRQTAAGALNHPWLTRGG